MYPHPIRLRGPWEVEPVAQLVRRADGRVEVLEGPVPPKFRVRLPGRWEESGLTAFAGRVRFRRRFGYPGRIDAHERVWLTFEGGTRAAEVWLNDVLLGRRDEAQGPFEFEVTGLLKDRNELVVQVDGPEGLGEAWGEVALEVRCTAFLRQVRAGAVCEGAKVSLRVSGDVVGTADRPLELYVLLDGATLHYTTVEPAPEGRPFQVLTALSEEQCRPRTEGPGGEHVVRVDLVNGATIWYAYEALVALVG